MSNIHGFDFLRTEHVLPSAGGGGRATPDGEGAFDNYDAPPSPSKYVSSTASAHRSDLEKQFDVLKFLNIHRSSGCLPPRVVHSSTGVQLNPTSPSHDVAVAEMLAANPKVRIEEVPDPENPTLILPHYGYQAKFSNVVDSSSLLAQINRCKNGVGVRDLIDSYDGVEDDVNALVAAGDVLAVANPEDKDRVLFPRGEQFLVELDGIVSVAELGKFRSDVRRLERECGRARDRIMAEAEAEALAGKEGSEADGGGSGESGAAEGAKDGSAPAEAALQAKEAPAEAVGPDSSSEQGTKNGDDVKQEPPQASEAATELDALTSKLTEARRRVEVASYLISSDVDPRTQIRRGEAINVGGTWFRLSSAIREGVPLSEQPARAQAPPSVVLMKDLSRKNDADGYVRPYNDKALPLDRDLPEETVRNVNEAKAARERIHRLALKCKQAGGRGSVTGGASSQLLGSNASASSQESLAAAFVSGFRQAGIGGPTGGARKRPGVGRVGPGSVKASKAGGSSSVTEPQQSLAELMEEARQAALDPSLVYAHARRHGCTKDVREIFLATRADVPETELELYNVLLEHKLIEAGEPMRRPRIKIKNSNLDNDGKPKKRRYYERKNQRMTNIHLVGTEIGAVLAKAAQRQQEGKQVGDGGM